MVEQSSGAWQLSRAAVQSPLQRREAPQKRLDSCGYIRRTYLLYMYIYIYIYAHPPPPPMTRADRSSHGGGGA